MKTKKILLSIIVLLGVGSFCITNAFATTWYVRDGGGNAAQCTGTTNAVYPGSGSGQACAFNNPMFVLGAGCGNFGFGPCDVNRKMASGDTLSISGDSDLHPGAQAQYPIGYDATGAITPTNSANCSAAGSLNCTMSNPPAGSDVNHLTQIIGIGTHKPQLWGREKVNQVLEADSNNLLVNNIEVTEHSSCAPPGYPGSQGSGGFPASCQNSAPPFGPWAKNGVFYGGTNMTLENMWIHGISGYGTETDNLSNVLSYNNTINGNGFDGDGIGQLYSGSTVTINNVTWNQDRIVFNGCQSVYPAIDSDPYNMANYWTCYDDNNSGFGDGLGMEANTGICTGNLIVENSDLSFNTKGGLDFLHCQGDGNFYVYRTRAEGNEGQAFKFNNANVYMENSEVIGNCYWFAGQSITYKAGAAPDYCRAAGDAIRFIANGGTYSFVNSTLNATSPAIMEYEGSCSGTLNMYNDNVIGGYNTPVFGNNALSTWVDPECSVGSVKTNEDYNHVWNTSNQAQCAGAHDKCNDINAGTTTTITTSMVGPTAYYAGEDFGHLLYPASSGQLVANANNAITLQGTSDDFNNYARGTSWTIGSYQLNSYVINGGACFNSGECYAGASCTNSICGSTNTNPQPVVTITSPVSGSSFTAASNITITTAASETNGTISNISLYNGAGVLLGSSSSSPYNYVMSNAIAGTYTFDAVAKDANGVSVTSSPVTITITPQSLLTSLPVVAITSPISGSSFTAGSNITITTTASETNGTISNISLYNGAGVLLGSSSISPFNFVDTNALAGTYTFYAVAKDANGVSVTSSSITLTVTAAPSPPVTITVNPFIAPTLSITSPVNNGSYTVPASITLTSSASDNTASILRVDYYAGSIYLGEAYSSPYTVVWSSAQAGTYSLTAKATDANGSIFYSAPVNITVNSHAAPAISLTSPINNAVYAKHANIILTANASATGGSITKVDFYANGYLYLGTVYDSPYSLTWYNVRRGTYSLAAKATDSYGWSTTSTAVNITVN